MRRAPSGRLSPLDPRLLRVCPALKRHVLVLGVLLTLRGVCTLAGALLLARAVVRVVDGHSPARVLLLLAAVVLARAGLDAVTDLLGSRASTRVQRDLRATALGSMEAAGPAWLRAQEQTRAAHVLGPGLDVLDGYVTRALPALVATVVVPVVVLAGIGSQDLLSLGLLLLVLPLVPLFLVLLGLTTRDRTERSRATLALLAAKVLDLLQGLPSLKIHGRAAGQVAALGRVTELHRVQTLAALRWALVSGLVLDLLASLSVALVAVGAGLRLESGALPLTAALTVLLLAPEVFAPLRAVGTHHHASTEALSAVQEVLELVDQPAAPRPPAGPAPSGSAPSGSVAALLGVTVRHPGRTVDAVRGVDLVLRTGEVVAVLGPSGSGKSTLLDVLAGAVPPTTGALRGGPGADVVLCPQLPRPTRATVGAEVLLGDPGATGEQLLAVLAACAAPTARTPLGEAGRALSAGQRRRVALARTLLRGRAIAARGGRPLVLLDEPSEDLDRELEEVVAEVVQSLSAIATVVLVTHSESLAEIAGRRVDIRDGRVSADRVVPARRVAPLERHAGPDREPRPAPGPTRLRLRSLVPVFRDDGSGLHGRLLLAVGVGAAGAVAALGLAAASGWLVLRASQHPGEQALAVAVVAVRAAALAKPLLRYAERLTGHDLALRVLTRTRVRVLRALVPLAPSGLELWRRGDLLRRFSADVDAVQDVLVRGLLPVTTALTTAAVGLVAVSLLSPASVVPLAVLLGATALVLPLAALLSRGAGSDAAGSRDERTVAWVEGYRELWGLGALADSAREISRLDDEVARGAARERWVRAGAALVSSIAAGLGPVVVLAGAAGGTTSGLRVGVAALVAIAAVEPLAATGPVWASAGAALHRAGRVAAVLRLPAPVPEPASPVAPPTGRLGVLLADASVGHGTAVLTGVDLVLGPGVRLAVTGPSGCGKSSLLDTVLRLLPVRAGTAALTDGSVRVGLGDLAADAVPALLTGCLQDDHVFATTLRENLRIGRPGADDADLDDVARRLDLLSWVRGLPDGWGTRVGEDGARLSGGQRQRVLLARALLSHAQVLVLDEPTAHLDRETEALVMRDLIRATEDRTLLLATHRRDTLDGLDAVVDVTRQLQPV